MKLISVVLILSCFSCSFALDLEPECDSISVSDNETHISYKPDASVVEQINRNFGLINDYLSNKDFEKAISLLEESEKLDPQSQYISKTLATALNNYAVELASQGRYSKSIDLIEQAYVINPSEQLKNNYVKILMGDASARIEAGEMNRAVKICRYALEVDPGNQKILQMILQTYLLSGEKLFKDNRLEKSKGFFYHVLKIDPDQKDALYFLGRIAYLQQRLAYAKYYWQKLLEIDTGNKNVREMLARVDREMTIQPEMSDFDAQHFNVHYDKSISSGRLSTIYRILEEVYYDVGHRFSCYPKEKITVLFLEKNRFMYTTNTMHFVAGLYDGKIRIPLNTDDKTMARVISHEYVHAVIHYLAGNKVPLWFNEGSAERFSHETYDYKLFKSFMLDNKYIRLKNLSGALKSMADLKRMRLAYEESMLFVDFILYKYGMDKIKKFISLCANDVSSEKIIRKLFGYNMDEFEKKFKEYAKRKLLSVTERKKLRYKIKSSRY